MRCKYSLNYIADVKVTVPALSVAGDHDMVLAAPGNGRVSRQSARIQPPHEAPFPGARNRNRIHGSNHFDAATAPADMVADTRQRRAASLA
jgi:hypothetical protein